MRVRDLFGWPPSSFQSAEMPPRAYTPPHPKTLRILSVMFLPGPGSMGPGDLLLLLSCKVSGKPCFAKVKVATSTLGCRAVRALSMCHGLSLAQAGMRRIPSAIRAKAPAPR